MTKAEVKIYYLKEKEKNLNEKTDTNFQDNLKAMEKDGEVKKRKIC